MQITYTITPEDIVAFHRFQMRHAGAWRRSIIIGLGSGVVTAAFLFILLGGWQSWLNAVFPVIFLVVYLILFPLYIRRAVNRTGVDMVRDGKNKGVWGPHTLTIDESGVDERTDVGESSVRWQGVEKVAASPTHLYIFVSSNAAHVIPRRAFGDPQQAEQFLRQAESYLKHAQFPE